MDEYIKYRGKDSTDVTEMRPFVPGEDYSRINTHGHTPGQGGMVAKASDDSLYYIPYEEFMSEYTLVTEEKAQLSHQSKKHSGQTAQSQEGPYSNPGQKDKAPEHEAP